MNPSFIHSQLNPDLLLLLFGPCLLVGGTSGPERPRHPGKLLHFIKCVAMLMALFGLGAGVTAVVSFSGRFVLPILAAGLVVGLAWAALTCPEPPPGPVQPTTLPPSGTDDFTPQSMPESPLPVKTPASPDDGLPGVSIGVVGAFIVVLFFNAFVGPLGAGVGTLAVSSSVAWLLVRSPRTESLAWGFLCGGAAWGILWILIARS